MRFYECLPDDISFYISTLNGARELRIRNGRAARINVDGTWYFVGKNTLLRTENGACVLGDVCDDIVKRACNSSVYAYEKTLSAGFFTLDDGVRIGVAGDIAGNNGNIFRKYTSLCFRIPHCVHCVDEQTFKYCAGKNVIVIGVPNSGKTTFLRDFAFKSSFNNNVLVADERGELFYSDSILQQSDCDVLKWTSKEYAFEIGARALSPDILICDEINSPDVPFVRSCINSGIKLACSAHGADYGDFTNRFGLDGCFDVAVVLSKDMRFYLKDIYNNE